MTSKCCKSSRSKARSLRDITCQKFAKLSIIQPGIARFRSDFDHMTLDRPRTFQVYGSKSEGTIIAWRNVSASKNAIIQASISCQRSNLAKIILELSTTRYMAFKVIRSNIEIAITLSRIARLRSDLVQCLITSQAIHKCSRSKVKVTGSKINVTA